MRTGIKVVAWLAAVAAVVAVGFVVTQPDDVSYGARLDALYQKLPEAYFAAKLDGPPARSGDYVLNPKLQYRFQWAAKNYDFDGTRKLWEIPAQRQAIRDSVDLGWTYRALLSAPMKSVQDQRIPGPDSTLLPIRIYLPHTQRGGTLPVMVYYHGGAFVMGSIKAVDRTVKVIANEAESIVVSVDYRLAPEHPYPAANADAIAAYEWVAQHAAEFGGDPNRIAVGGDSAGGYLSVVVSNHQIENGSPPPVYQLLYYPAADFRMNYPSARQFAKGFGLDLPLIDFAIANTFPHGLDTSDPLTHVVDLPTLGRMPPSLISVAGFDPIRDSGIALARNMQAAGVKAELRIEGSLAHNFLEYSGVIADSTKAALETARAYGRFIWNK